MIVNLRAFTKLFLTRPALDLMIGELEEELIHAWSIVIIAGGGVSILALFMVLGPMTWGK